MPTKYDATEFIDGDFEAHKMPYAGSAGGPGHLRAPTREEVDSKVADAQQKLAELKRAQEELERERTALEETRRRQIEFQTGRQEMIQNLTRGVGLLEEAEFNHRREAEQMTKALVDLRDALAKVEAVQEESWTKDNFGVELTRALTTLENARMEWNGARLKFPVLSGEEQETTDGHRLKQMEQHAGRDAGAPGMAGLSFITLCKLGLALSWPIILLGVLALVGLLVALLRP
jgi:hypothetical protein